MDNDIMTFGHNSFITWTRQDLEAERRDEEQEESVFSDNKDWYLRMKEDQRRGYADYE
jgi:hypothetical protein